MRIADKMALTQVQSNLGKNRAEMHRLQEQSSTQRRLNKPSDDPLATTRVLGLKTDEANQKQFIKSLHFAKDFLNFTDQSLSEVSEVLTRAKELAINQANEASANPDSRRAVATEVEQLLMQTVQVANRKLGDRYIFSGFRSNQAPFTKTGHYRGDQGEIKIQVNSDSYIAMNLPGNKVFLGEGAGSEGTENREVPRNSEQLQDHKRERHEVETQRSQQVPLSQVFSKDPQSRSLASVPGLMMDEGDGEGQGEFRGVASGSEAGANLFSVLQHLVVSLKTDNKPGIQESLDQIDLAFDQVVAARAQVGARVMSLDQTLDSLQKGVSDAKISASQLEDADVFQLVSDINRADTALKATLETSGRLIQPSLLDFLK